MPANRSTRHCKWVLPSAGLLIGLMLLAATGLSGSLAGHLPVKQQPVAAFVALMTAAGVVYAAAVLHCRAITDSTARRNWIVVFAIGLRLTMLTGTPILEDDHYRYLWDGAQLAHGLNPYRHAPADVRDGTIPNDKSAALPLDEPSGRILARINYPWLRTIYPPLAQAAFALAHVLSPWKLWGWRLVLAVFELSALLILCRLNVSLVGLLIYGWNPLLIKEVYNSGHVDALMLPLLLVAVVGVERNRPLGATAALGAAGGIKLWPLILMPMIWRRLANQPRVLAASLALFGACLAGTLGPMLLSGWNESSGLSAYVRYWEMNDALYTLVAWTVNRVTALMPLPPACLTLMPRLAAAILLAGGVLWLVRQREMAIGQQCLMTVTLLFMISPTQFPWYYLWLLPFLALHPHPALVVYPALLPLYYLRPWLAADGHEDAFDRVIVWVQHGPVMLWLFWDWVLRRRQGAAGA